MHNDHHWIHKREHLANNINNKEITPNLEL